MDNFQAFCVCLCGGDEFICQISTEDVLFGVHDLNHFFVYQLKIPNIQNYAHATVPVQIYFSSK